MPHNSFSSPSSTTWWPGDDVSISEAPSPGPPSIGGYSPVSESVITLPIHNAWMPRHTSGSTPEFREKIESASPETARHVALRMYESLKRHGLREEVGRAFMRKEIEKEDGQEGDQVNENGVRKKSEELMGMEYLLKDGFVSYLRDVAKITPPIPQQVVRFSGLKYSKKLCIPSDEYETFGNKVLGFFVGPFRSLFQKKESTWLHILKGVDGYIMPGSMTLLLGPPGCGKSSLLEILAGRVETRNSNLQGVVMYNDKDASEIRLSRLMAYISGQLNKHIPFLSVRETLEFARDCTQGLRPENFTPQMRKFFAHALVEGQDPFLEYVLEILSLKNVEHKLTGEAISGIDRQKLTTAELALGTYSVMLYDQPLAGSDLAATYDLVDTIRTISRIQQSSAIMSLTQISQEVFDLFDRIILLGHGHILFQGPRQDAIPYFSNLGYKKPSHVESAEFLEDIVAGHGSQYMASEETALTIDELIECYRASDHYKDVARIAHGDDVKLTCWVESEPGLGLSLKTPSKYHSLSGGFTGNLQANGVKPGATFFKLIGYVEKLDAHQPYLSVRESLQFSAALRLDPTIDPTSSRIHVELVLNQLGLMPYSNQLVGSLRDGTGKTFEIAKKMTIAVELAANPSILYLEEPISGLNTTGTLTILNTLYQVSESGCAIIATLTHPNARSLSFFDQALILTQEGKQAYFGPIGSNCSDLLDYFTSIPKAPPHFIGKSPVSFVMGALGLGIKTRGTSLNFAEIYKASSLHEINNKQISSIKKLTRNRTSWHSSSTYAAPYSRQAILVLLRTQRFLWRNVQYTYGRLTGCIMIGLLMGSLYFQIEYKDVYGVTSRSLYIYMQVILIGVISANNVIPQIGTDRLVYFREKRAGMYLPIFYPVSWAVAEIPYFVIATLAVVGIGNGMAGIGTGSAAEFVIYWLALFAFTLCVTYFGMMVTFLAPVPTLAAFIVSIVTSLWVSASGVVVVLSDIKFYRWMYWSNPFQFAMNAMTSISFYLSAMCLLFACLAFLFFVVLKHNSANHV